MLMADRFLKYGYLFFGTLNKGKRISICNLFLCLFTIGVTLIPTWTSAMGQEIEGSVAISVRDIGTGYALPAFISISKVKLTGSTGHVIDSFQLPLGQEVLKSYSPGKYIIGIKMKGYKPMKSWFAIESGKTFSNRYMLSPSKSKIQKFQEKTIQTAIPSNIAVISGYVIDDETGQPLEEVHITFNKPGIETYTSQKGYFKVSIPVEEGLILNGKQIRAIQETIVLSLLGYKTLKEVNVLILPNHPLKENFIMFKGKGEIVHDRTHPLLYPGEKNEKLNTIDHISSFSVPLEIKNIEKESSASAPMQFMIPPPTIRVGFSSTWGRCSGKTCTKSRTYPLEEYVRLGWGHEWFPSWGRNALRAGAVAYRSYGAWHVRHPISRSYDICSSAACQVFDTYDEGLTPQKTAGIMLQKNDRVFFAEYSAENNNYPCDGGPNGDQCSGGGYKWTSCGDGYAGRPHAWPCLSDPVREGKTLNGHGGGMSQWGTYSWDLQGKTWVWMVNHYYNDNGNPSGQRSSYMTSPLKITSASPTSKSVSPGQTVQINISAHNYAGLSHTQIIIGATLHSDSTGHNFNDVSHDKKVVLKPGPNNINRLFTVPSSIPPGTYDLLLGLWLDVNEDNRITSTDLPLSLKTISSAITVQSSSDITPPTITITGPTSSNVYTTSSSNLNINGTASDNVGITQVTWSNNRGGRGTVSGTISWNVRGVTLQDGTNVITVTAKDAAGNTGTDTLTVTYTSPDITPPTVSVSSPCSSSCSTSDSSTTISGLATDSGGSGLDKVFVDNVTNGSYGYDNNISGNSNDFSVFGISLSQGQNIILTKAYDIAGNYSNSYPIYVTYTPPNHTNLPPIIDSFNANPTNANAGDAVTFTATAHDPNPDGTISQYKWDFGDGTAVQITTTGTVSHTYSAAGTYNTKVTVVDNKGAMTTSNFAVIAVTAGNTNRAPLANAGVDRNVTTGSTVTLNGSGSSDTDHNPLTYSWSFVSRPSGSNTTLSDSTAIKPAFTADVAGSYVIQLVVNDGTVGSAADRVTITAAAATSPSVQIAAISGQAGSSVNLPITIKPNDTGIEALRIEITFDSSKLTFQDGSSVLSNLPSDWILNTKQSPPGPNNIATVILTGKGSSSITNTITLKIPLQINSTLANGTQIGISLNDSVLYAANDIPIQGVMLSNGTITVSVASHQYNLNVGWNLISIPALPQSTSILDVLNSISSQVGSVWSYQNGSWKEYDPNNTLFNNLSTMEPGYGYWIKMNSSAVLTISGSTPTVTEINLTSGWNLVGLEGTTPFDTMGDALISISSQIGSVWSYQNGSWKEYDPNNTLFNNLSAMEPGYGYWIKMNSNGVWNSQ